MALNLRNDLDDNRKIILKTKNIINRLLESFALPKILNNVSFIVVLKLIFKREENFAKHLIYIDEKDGFY